MVRFSHISDVHLGGWKQKPMQDLNFQYFEKAIDVSIQSKVDFILIAGDLFDSAYPPIDILKGTFRIFKKIHDHKIPVFLIAGSHDYSISGKTFLDVLEKAGFCKNVTDAEVREDSIVLNPTIHEGVAIYGYPGKKAGLEIPELRKVKLQDAPGMFKIFMLHTTLDKVVGSLPIDSLEFDKLPRADYYALGHIHIDYKEEGLVYPGPIFPNNFHELEDLKGGGFYLVDTESINSLEKVNLRLKDVFPMTIEITDALNGTDQIISEIEKYELKDKIVLLRIWGDIEKGKVSDIKFQRIEEAIEKKEAYFLLRNTHDLKVKDPELDFEITDSENIESETIKFYGENNPSRFNKHIDDLMGVLSSEKQEGEKNDNFESRVLEEAKKVLKF